jgi:muconolactone delta-isomerase
MQHPVCGLPRIFRPRTPAIGVRRRAGTPWSAAGAASLSCAVMALYFVTLDLEKPADPQLPVDRLAHIVREAILPSVEALIPLKAQGRLVTGGYLVGERSMMFVFEADSEEEVREVLEGLPLLGVVTAELRPMQPLGDLHTLEDL